MLPSYARNVKTPALEIAKPVERSVSVEKIRRAETRIVNDFEWDVVCTRGNPRPGILNQDYSPRAC